jgi:hypothetical protein
LAVCLAPEQPSTWWVTFVLKASPVQGAKSDTQNGINGRAPHSGGPLREPCFWVPKSTPRTGFGFKVETGLVSWFLVSLPTVDIWVCESFPNGLAGLMHRWNTNH